MKKPFLLIFLFFCTTSLSFSQSTTPVWSTFFSGGVNYPQHITKTHPAGVVVSTREFTTYKIFTILINNSGTVVWQDTFDFGHAEYLTDLKVDDNGNIYVLIASEPIGGGLPLQKFIILKYSPSGALLLTTVFNQDDSPYDNERDIPYSIDVDDFENMYVLSKHQHGNCTNAETKTLLSKFSPTGVLLWTINYTFNTIEPGNVMVNTNGTIFVTFNDNTGGTPDRKIVAHDSTNGTALHTYNYVPPPLGYATGPFHLEQGPNHDVFAVIGLQYYNRCVGVYRLSETCNQEWWYLLNDLGANDIYFTDFDVDASSNVYVVSHYSHSPGPGNELAQLSKVDSAGNFQWADTYQVGDGNNMPRDIEIASNGDAMILCVQDSGIGYNSPVIRRVDAQGNLVWISDPLNFSNSTTLSMSGLAANPTGGVYFSGGVAGGDFMVYYDGPNTTAVNVGNFSGVHVYPNPFQEFISVVVESAGTELTEVKIFDALGRPVRNQFLTAGQASIETSGLSRGVYFLQIEQGGGVIFTQTLVRE